MWDYLKNVDKPIVLYGTGNACERIMAELKKRNIVIAGIFASDDFVRKGKVFHGFPVLSYAEQKARFGDMLVLLCFGTERPEVIENIKKISSECELLAPDLPVAGGGLFDRAFFEANRQAIDKVRARLADEQSRLVLDSVIKYRLTGKLSYLSECETDNSDLWNISGLSDHEDYLDLGAYTGDTVDEFITACGGRYKSITAVEAGEKNFQKLVSAYPFIDAVNAAAGARCGECEFPVDGGRSIVNKKTHRVNTVTIDALAADRPFSLIKFDIEGFEHDALSGGMEHISKNHPKMIVAAYHRTDDLWTIPQTVLSYYDGYEVYLRHSPCFPAWEINYIFRQPLYFSALNV